MADIDAGSVSTRLGFDYTGQAEFEKFDRALDKAERRKRIETELAGDFDDRHFDAFERALDRAEAKAKRRGAYTAALGGDFDGRAFASAERSLNQWERQAARAEQGNRRLGGSLKNLDTGLVSLSSRLPLVKWSAYAAGAAAALPPTIALAGALGPLTGLLGAIPGLAAAAGGSLVAGMLGMRGVGDAVGAAWDQQLTAATDATGAAQQAESAMESVQAAEERLADAHRNAKRAQTDVNDARDEATQRLEDMRIEIERAALAERGSALSLKQARQELARLEAEPAGDDPATRALALAEARQRVAEAEADLEDTRRDGQRTQRDYAEAEAQGVRRMPEVLQARERLADANRDVKSASQDLARASRDAGQAMGEGTGGAQKLQEKLDDLSPAGRAFVALIEGRFFPLFTRLRNEAQEGLLPGLGRGLIQAERNFPVLERMVGNYADALGDAAEQQGRLFGSRAQGRDMENIFGQGERLIRRSADAAIDWERGLTHVAVAADPILDWVGDMNVELADMFEEWARGGRESGRLERFFERATRKAELFVEGLWDGARGLINIGRIGARVWGDDMLVGINDALERFRAWTESVRGARDIEGYFRRWRARWGDISDAMGRVIRRYRQLREEGKTVTEAAVQALSEAFARGLPKIAEAAGRAAPHVVEGFISGFLAADAWGKLAIGGWLLAKFGGLGAIRGIGGTVAAALFGGMAAGGTGGKLAGLFGGRGSTPANPLFVMPVGGGLAPGGGVAPAPGGGGRAGGRLGGLVRGGLAIGATAIVAPEVIKWGTQEREADRAREAVARFNHELGEGGIEAVDKRIRALQENSRHAHRYSGAQKEELANLRRLRAEYNRHRDELKRTQDQYKANTLIASNFRSLAAAGRTSLRALSNVVDSNMDAIKRSLGERSEQGSRALRANFRGAMRALGSLLRGGKVDSETYLRQIARLAQRHSKGSKDNITANFRGAVRAIRKAMRDGRVATDDGLAAIRKLSLDALKMYGFSGKEARKLFRAGVDVRDVRGGEDLSEELGRGPQGLPGATGGYATPFGFGPVRAATGFLGRMGERGRDLVHAILGRGEAVLNHYQQRIVNNALMRNGIRGLPELFSRTRSSKHYMAAGGIAGDGGSIADHIPAFARGGIAGMITAANRLDRAGFEYRWGGGHQASPAPFGPMDCSGAVSYVLQHGGVKIPTMVSGALMSAGQPGPGPVTVFADAGHTFMRIQGRYFGTSGTNPGGGAGWFPDPGDAYKSQFAQRHFDVVAGPDGIPRVVIRGPASPLRAAAQASVDTGRGAALSRLDQIMATPIGSGDPGDSLSGDGNVERIFAQVARRLSTSRIATLALGEAGYAESGMTDEPGGLGTSEGALQLLASTARGLGVDPHDEGAVSSLFLLRGFAGKGGANALAGTGLPAHMVAQGVQGSAFSSGSNYADEEGRARGWMARFNLASGGFAGDGASIADYLPFAGSFAPGGFVGGGGMWTSKGTKFRDRSFRVIGTINRDIEQLGKRYELDNRRADLTEEEFIIEGDENTPPSLDQAAIERRVAELDTLVATRRKITMKYARLVRYIDRLLKVYLTMRERLERTVKRLSNRLRDLPKRGRENRRTRKALGERLDDYQGTLTDVRERIGELGPQLDDARYEHESSAIDLKELRLERQPLLGGGAGLELPEFTPAESDGGEDLQAQLEQSQARTAALEAANLAIRQAFSVFTGPGDLAAGGPTALQAAMAPFRGAGPVGPGAGVQVNPQGQLIGPDGQPVSIELGGGAGGVAGIPPGLYLARVDDVAGAKEIARHSNRGNDAMTRRSNPYQQVGVP